MAICRGGFFEMADMMATRTVFAGPTVASLKLVKSLTLSIVHLHIGERFDATYNSDGAYVLDQVAEVD